MSDEKISVLQHNFGVNIPIPTIKLPDRHPCSGCHELSIKRHSSGYEPYSDKIE